MKGLNYTQATTLLGQNHGQTFKVSIVTTGLVVRGGSKQFKNTEDKIFHPFNVHATLAQMDV